MPITTGSLLPFFAVLRVSGEDRAAFLHSQLSNDIHHLPSNHACYATYNTAKGRVIANMLVLNRGHDLLLLLAKDLAEVMIKRLSMYILRSKVTLDILAEMAVAGLAPEQEHSPQQPQPSAHSFSATQQTQIWQITLPHHGILWVGPHTHLPPYHEAAAWHWQNHELQCGYPWISMASSETCVAQMLNQHLLGGVHFKKGCYPGQEIIARAQYRGQVKRGLALFSASSALSSGDKLFTHDGEEVGIVINQAPQAHGSFALAVIKFSATNQTLYTEQSLALTPQYAFFTAEASI